jgi:hypothetical protein
MFFLLQPARLDTPQPTTFQVSSGIYIRHAPHDMVLFRDYSTILFKVKFGFHQREDHLHELLLSSCAIKETEFRSTCLLATPLTFNLQSLNTKLNSIHIALTNEQPMRMLGPPTIRPLLTTTPTPFERQLTGIVNNLIRLRRDLPLERPKRQLFLGGLAAGYIGSKLFSFFDHTSVDTASMYTKLTKGMDIINHHVIQEATAINLVQNQTFHKIHAAVAEFNLRIGEFRNETNKLTRDMHHGELRNLLLLTEALQEQLRSVELFQYSLILSACTSGRLPSSAVSPGALRRELTHMQRKLLDRNFTLVIPVNDLSSYFFHELTHCHFNHEKDEIVVSLSVPIKPSKVKYSLVETIAVPFLDTDSTGNPNLCSVDISHQLVVIEQGPFSTNAVPIDLAQSSQCSLKPRFCFYNEFSSTSRISTDCMRLLLTGATAEYLREVCPFHCRPARVNETSIVSLESKPDDAGIFAVTNPPANASVTCLHPNNTVRSITPLETTHSLGSHLIVLADCLCHIDLRTRIIRVPHPCRINSIAPNEVRILIPSRWTNLSSTFVLMADTVESDILTGPSFSNVTEIYDPSWQQKALVIGNDWNLKFPKYSDFVTHFTNHETTFTSYVGLLWNCVLTAAIICLWCRMNVTSWGARAAGAAYPTVAYLPTAQALDDASLDHKINVFLWTVGSICATSFIIFLIVLVVCIRKWRPKRFRLQCVPLQDTSDQHMTYEPEDHERPPLYPNLSGL